MVLPSLTFAAEAVCMGWRAMLWPITLVFPVAAGVRCASRDPVLAIHAPAPRVERERPPVIEAAMFMT